MKLEWTEQTITCYKNGCTCSTCNAIPHDIKKNCRLKKTVMDLVTELGRPNDDILLEYGSESVFKTVSLTTDERTIIKLLPLENKEIAERLCCSKEYIETCLYALLSKFKVKTKTALLAKVLFYEIITLGEIMKCLN